MYGCTYIRTDRVTLNAPGIVMGGGGGGGGGIKILSTIKANPTL